MGYSDAIERADIAPPEDLIPEIIDSAIEASVVMQLGRRLRDMARNQTRMRVIDSLPTAYFVDGDTGLKQTTNMAWDNVYINAEELAVIVPVPENVLDDNDYDIWSEVRPRIAEAMGAAFDAAVLFGTNAPASWPDDILTDATSASQTVNYPTGADLYSDILGEGGIVSLVEEDGYFVTGHVAAISLRAKMRDLRTAEGDLIFKANMQESTTYTLDGAPVYFPRNGFDAASALDIAGDWSQLMWAMRRDMTFKLSTEGVISDGSGNIVLNLFQQDSVALRCTMRLGWCLPNPLNRVNTNDSTRYPFAVLLP